ncbi:RING-type E3 ubiquitin transferase [Sarracenia purpurea var. burkii]
MSTGAARTCRVYNRRVIPEIIILVMNYPRRLSNDEIASAMFELMVADRFEAVPTIRFSIETALERVVVGGSCSRNQCTICLEKFSVGSEIARMPCSHVYHRGCIVQWLMRRNSCPLCQYQIPTWNIGKLGVVSGFSFLTTFPCCVLGFASIFFSLLCLKLMMS